MHYIDDNGIISTRCERCGEWFDEFDEHGVIIDGTCSRILEGTHKQFGYCCPECANRDGWHTDWDGNWEREFHVQNWSQEAAVYRGTRSVKQTVVLLTVEDVLWAMYEVNVPLTDENLDEVLDELNGYLYMESHYDLQAFVDKVINGRS